MSRYGPYHMVEDSILIEVQKAFYDLRKRLLWERDDLCDRDDRRPLREFRILVFLECRRELRRDDLRLPLGSICNSLTEFFENFPPIFFCGKRNFNLRKTLKIIPENKQ